MTVEFGQLPADLNVSRETQERLEIYATLLKKWNTRINLVSPGTISELWTRHIVDSIQLEQFAPQKTLEWCDLGQGQVFRVYPSQQCARRNFLMR